MPHYLDKMNLLDKLALIVGAVGIAIGAIGLTSTKADATPSHTSPEAGFSRDMTLHHAQAIEMSFIVRENTSDTAVRALAFDVINTQSVQVGMMQGWLQQWDLPSTSSAPPMEWMASDHEAGADGAVAMPGMATEAEMRQLRESRGRAAEALYLELMIKHHLGGVHMAQGVIDLTNYEEVRQLAEKMVAGQQSEITAMEDMLKDRSSEANN